MDEPNDPSEVLRRLDAYEAQHLWVIYHNYSALNQGKVVPRQRFEEVARDGVSFALANWDFAISDEQLPHPGFGADSGDFRVIPDPATIVALEHRPGVAQAFGWLADGLGDPWPGDPRARLRDQVESLAESGLAVSMAFEAEFALAVAQPDGEWVPADRGRMFVIDGVDARWAWWARLLQALERAGVPVHQMAKEYGPAQYEISLLPSDPVTAADRFLLARQLVKSLAREAGVVATFMPRPWGEFPANGLHTHLSLVDATGTPAIPDPSDDQALSPVGRGAVAGLLAHADGQCALAAPIQNSYRRLQPGSWAPAHRCWGFGNRAALVRIPGQREGRHIEYRLGDASANPYLHATGLLAAMRDGIVSRLTPPAPAAVDVGHLTDQEAAASGFERLPSDTLSALAAFEGDRVLGRAVGPVIREHYPRVKRFEHQLGEQARARERSDAAVLLWDRQTYLEAV